MGQKHYWTKGFVLFLLFALTFFFSGWYLLPGFLKPAPAQAADLAAFSVAPVSAGSDDLIGQTGASWQFTFQTETALQPGQWVQIIFPDTSTMNMPPFDFSSFSVSAATSTGEASLRFNTASSTMMGQNIIAVPVAAPQASTSLPFTITISGVGNPIADINMIPNSFTWSGQTTASNGATVIDGPRTATASLVRRGDMISQWDFSLSDYSASASGVEFSFSFTASTSLAVGEKIAVNFPSNFVVSAATTSDQTIVAGGQAQVASTSLAVNTNYGLNSVILTISGGGIDPTATATVSFKIGNITNPVKGSYNGLSIYTLTAAGGLVDGNPYGIEQPTGQMMGPPPVDSVQIGGTNTITGTVKVRRANGNLETVTAAEAAQIKVGMGCPEKMFHVGTKLINSDGTFTYSHLLDARYMLFVMPASETNSDFFANYLAPAMLEVNVSGGQSVSLTPTFVVPDGVVIGTVTGAPAGATDGFVRAYNGLSETYAPIFNSPDYDQEGFSATGTGYIKVPVKSGYEWKINIMTNNILATGTAEYWPPVYKPINIPAGTATTTLPTKSFMLADQTLNVRVKDTNGTIIDESGDIQPCVNVRRAGGVMMDRGEPVCQTTNVNGENVFQVKVPVGAYVVEVMLPGAGFMEKPVTVNGTTTLDVIVAAPDSYISGAISDADGFPIQGAAVFAQGATGGFANDLTDSNGEFKLFVPPGTYSLDAFVPGYGPLTRKTSVVVTDTANATGQNWTLDNSDFATISGRVYVDSNGNSAYDAGEGLEGVKMYAHNPTTDKGSFTVTLSDGQYTLRVPKASGWTVGGFSDEVGDLPPLNNVDATSDISGQDFALGALGTLTVTISGGNNAGSDFFLHAYNPSANRGNGTNSWAASGSDLVASLDLPAGSYEVHIGSPAFGDLMDLAANAAASSTTITANATTYLTVSLPTLVTVSGTVAGGANATVWISRLDGPGQYSTMADQTTANFSLKVPAGYTYQLGANLPGYTNTPITLSNLTTATSVSLSLTAAAGTISGTLSGEGTALSEGFVWAQKSGGEGWVGAEVNADGSYTLYIGSGSWQVYADAPCYYQSDGQTVSGSQTLNIDLTAISGCSREEPTVQSITPTAGGAIKKKIGDNEVAVNIPANALGTESDNVTVSLNQPGVLPPNSANSFPIDNAAVAITAADSSGSSISTLNSAADITLTYSDDDLPSGADEDDLQLAYWDTTTQTWQTVAATIDTENNTITASVDHFTDFAPILPTAQGVPDTPSGLTVQKYGASGSDTKLSLSWSRVDGADGYYLYRDTSASGTFPLLATISSGATVSYTDSGLTGNTTYYYKITAKNSNGESAASAAVSAATCASVEHGTVSGASCSIACASGYTLSGSSCVQSSTSGGGSPWYIVEANNSQNQAATNTEQESQNPGQTQNLIEKVGQTISQAAEKVSQTVNSWQAKIVALAQEAADIWQASVGQLMQKFGLKRNLSQEKLAAQRYVQKLTADYPKITALEQYALINFVTYGTPNTFALGAGERAGVLNSYQTAFAKLPASQADWDDVLKIACGRWPAKRSQTAEARAENIFQQIYLRAPDRTNPHDDAAVMIMAYGLRPSARNLASERAGIRIFTDIFGRPPASAADWDAVRAIAYSGAKR